jgi:hypothetical protein
VVELHVRVGVLAELTGRPERAAGRSARSAGWAGVLAEIAGRYADRDGELARLDADPGARFAGAGLRRHVQMRDRSCVAPGCRRPARKADLDHTRDHARGGATLHGNVEPLCEPHHMMKHLGGWLLTQPVPGRFRWCSPLGQVYWTRGEPIAPDLPEPLPGPDSEPDYLDPAQPDAAREIGPIFHPSEWTKLRPPEPPQEPPSPAEPDREPPF